MSAPKITLLITGLAVFTLLVSFALPKKFPVLTDQTMNGKTIDASYFANKKTIIIHMFLGCPGATNAIRNIEAIQDSIPHNIQVLYILENTPDQVNEFNSDEENNWSSIRKSRKLNPITQDIVAECETPNVRIDENGNMRVGVQCEKLRKELKIKYSPTFFFVNGDGKIIKRENGYRGKQTPAGMWKKLN